MVEDICRFCQLCSVFDLWIERVLFMNMIFINLYVKYLQISLAVSYNTYEVE